MLKKGFKMATITITSPLLGEVGDEEILEKKNKAIGSSRSERPKGTWRGEFVKSIVYAGLDAIVTCFSLISSISAGKLSSVDVLVLGIANLVADGISMGFGDYVSTSTEREVAAKERLIMEWDVTNYCGPQKLELLQYYQARGMDIHDATMVVNTFAKYKDILVDIKMVAQKGMLPLDKANNKPWKNGLVTFVAFIVFGSAPLLSFLVLVPFTQNDSHKFVGACVLFA
ncbi:uncharacterized protein LOC130793241 isoform X1 [Actinidia eriantha]|uniref:uncharacterized protein LOC130793241 isoform X1 n=1 Tax=Actinidia eriantha TaxID=165200 RepID=UPI0025903DF6|nr:uncharacterized protein LOC130793241 isoform X1 [Actinidia eriantha]